MSSLFFLWKNARLEGEGADDRVVAAGQIIEVVVVVNAELEARILERGRGRSGLTFAIKTSHDKTTCKGNK